MANRHDDLQTLLAKLKLSSMARVCSQLALKAAKEKLSHEAFLYELVRLECEEREQRRIERYLSGSKLPREKTFRTFQWDRLTPALRVQIERLRTGRFVEQAHNVVAVGPPGVGKSHLLAAVGHDLIGQGHSVLWTSTSALV
jgi:DNA replication protein DnaC